MTPEKTLQDLACSQDLACQLAFIVDAVWHIPNGAAILVGACVITAVLPLRAYWDGRAPLATAFWLIGGSAHVLFIALLKLFFVLIDGLHGTGIELPLYLFWCTLIAIGPLVFSYVCIWRCSFNTSWHVWGYLARAALFVDVANILILSLWPIL